MKHCCEDDRIIETDSKHQANRTMLKKVLFIQLTMCLIAIVCGLSGHSTVALADSVDFLSHVFLLTMSLYASGHGVRWIGRASLLKGISMTVIGFSVLVDAIQWGDSAHAPSAHALGIVGVLGLLSNMATFSLLNKLRHSDLNMHSSWLCSRNDILTHGSIIITSVLVALTQSHWPDTLVGLVLSAMIITSGLHVIRRSLQLLRTSRTELKTQPT